MFLNEVFLLQRCISVACSQCRLYRRANPGVNRRLEIFKQENPDLSKMKIGEMEVEDLEMDVANTRLLMKDYQKEHDKVTKRINFKRVERTYFDKIKNPNLLLWSEKEQIRQLHESQPDKWTFERLSASFPATPDVIKKIVRSQWMRGNPDSIRKHDTRVLANWKLFQEQKLHLPPHLSAHLSKFTARDRSLQAKESTDIVITDDEPEVKVSPAKSSQFADIIRNYRKSEDHSTEEMTVPVNSNWRPSKPGETYVLNIGKEQSKRRGKHFTLSEMRKSGKISSTLHATPEGDTAARDTGKEDRQAGVVNPSSNFSVPQRSYAETPDVSQTDDPPEEIPMKITIPKNKWKKGAVYKLNNCFYADDGEFLYKI